MQAKCPYYELHVGGRLRTITNIQTCKPQHFSGIYFNHSIAVYKVEGVYMACCYAPDGTVLIDDVVLPKNSIDDAIKHVVQVIVDNFNKVYGKKANEGN